MREKGLSLIVYVLLGFSFIAIILFIPLPYFSSDSGWYTGPSFAVRFLGTYEKGAPIEQVYLTLADATIKSPYQLECSSNADCRTYTVINQCKVYCGNVSGANANTTHDLNNNRVCDPAFWTQPSLNCECVLGRCVSLKK